MKKPTPGKTYLVKIRAQNKKLFYHTAMYIPEHWRESCGDDYYGDLAYSEENDQYYWPEGWYESHYEEEVSWKLSDPVVDFMELNF